MKRRTKPAAVARDPWTGAASRAAGLPRDGAAWLALVLPHVDASTSHVEAAAALTAAGYPVARFQVCAGTRGWRRLGSVASYQSTRSPSLRARRDGCHLSRRAPPVEKPPPHAVGRKKRSEKRLFSSAFVQSARYRKKDC